ncbi:hypothetical protein BH10ACI1_BH10ACI1_20480 [soil metagenome]
MSEDNKNGNTTENGENINNGEDDTTMLTAPTFPDPRDSASRDVILSQFISSLHYENGGIKNDWFGRVIGYGLGANPPEYYLRFGNETIPMTTFQDYVRAGTIRFQFSNATSIVYRTEGNVDYADITLDYTVTDYRSGSAVTTTKTNTVITHRIRPTYQIYRTVIPL